MDDHLHSGPTHVYLLTPQPLQQLHQIKTEIIYEKPPIQLKRQITEYVRLC